MRLIYSRENNEWCINTISYTVSIFSLKDDTRTETSCFSFNEKQDNSVIAVPALSGYLQFKRYYYERKRSNKHKMVTTKMIDNRFVSTFDEDTIKYDTSSKLDRLTAQIFGYALGGLNISDKGRERKYIFHHIGDNKIKTIFGDTNVKLLKKIFLTTRGAH